MIWKFTIIKVDNTETVVDEPIGWADAVLTLNRDKELHGVFFSYSLPVTFYGQAYTMIRSEYDTNGVEGFLRIKIEVDCNNSGDFITVTTARLNFSRLIFSEGAVCSVELPIEEDSAFTLFNSRKDQAVNLFTTETFDGNSLPGYSVLRTLTLQPKGIYKHVESRRVESIEWQHLGSDVIPSGSSCDPVEEESFFTIGMDEADLEEIQDYRLPDFERVDTVDDVKPILVCDDPGSYTFTFRLPTEITLSVDTESNASCGDCPGSDPILLQNATVKLCVKIGASVTEYTLIDGLQCNATYTNDYTWVEVLTADVAQDEEVRVYLYVKTWGEWEERLLASSDVTYEHRVRLHGATIDIVALVKDAASDCKVAMVNEALSRISEVITNDSLRVYSDYFGRTDANPYTSDADGCGSLEAVTMGLAIRANGWQPMAVSWKALFEGLNAIHCLGIGLESDPNRAGYMLIRVEGFEYFYSASVLLTLDNVPDIKITVLSDEYTGRFEVGYGKWEAEEYTGLDEFNTARTYRTTLQTVSTKQSAVSSLIASGYAIEVTRRRSFVSNEQDDWRYDNDWFVICVKRSGGNIVVEQGNITGATNLIDPDSIYNYRISPVRNLIRWMPFIMKSYVAPSAAEIVFVDGSGNIDASGTLTGGCIAETGSLSESEASVTESLLADATDGDPVYRPEVWEFRYPLSLADYIALKASPYGVIRVKGGQQTEYTDCYIRRIQYSPTKGEAQFELLPKFVV